VRSLPYYYDAMIFVLAITSVVLLVDTSSSSRSRRPRRVIRDGKGRNAPVIYDSYQIVCQIGPWKWDIGEFCTHWFITGDTGVGKTSAGLNKLLISLTEHYPRWGGLILDPKSVYWRTVQIILETGSRGATYSYHERSLDRCFADKHQAAASPEHLLPAQKSKPPSSLNSFAVARRG
jgi:hypothetical protein